MADFFVTGIFALCGGNF